ncbi:uncharacterized protein F4812DRAFT_342167 [Daldinia caldariorum]|uniref:uncharacterized protein n=1 Tax=Daldinia caldariorum TaxID=326644 RepID=UPI0020083EE7|nr:uncharacterized protein F4812DRAFT_342167 [Daldinia caldariorum]KAI1468718.1 hypothetical protein F4812DRAFT_342167 [Daldinia caldariorum]
MASWSMPLREQYAPLIPSPLNPSRQDTSKRRRRIYYPQVARREQSPTQILLRRQAKVAWRLMSSRDDGTAMTRLQTARNAKAVAVTAKSKEDYCPIGTVAEYYLRADLGCYNFDLDEGMRKMDMEKQAFAAGDYKGGSLREACQLLHMLTTWRSMATMGIFCIAGVLLAIRVIGIPQVWRT